MMIINKTNIPLIICQNKKSEDDAIRIQPNTSEFYKLEKDVTKLKVKTDTYKWSAPFDITTIGISGNAKLPREKKRKAETEVPEELREYMSDELDLGVTISAISQYPWNETKVITFLPRFILMNATHRPIVITQGKEDSEK